MVNLVWKVQASPSRTPTPPPHILSKTMPKVACWANELRWIMVFENDWMVPFIISTATEIGSCGSQRCLYLPSLAYALRSSLVRSAEKDLVLFNLYYTVWYPWKNALNAKKSLIDPSVSRGEVRKTYGFDYSGGYFCGQVCCWFTHRE